MIGIMEANTPVIEIRDAFLKLTQRLGGIFYEHKIEENAIWAIAKAVDAAFQQSVRSVKTVQSDAGQNAETLKHPAIVNLLKNIETQH